MAYLVVTEPGKEPYRHELKGSATIGRGVDCDLCLHDALLSRRHCRIEPIDKKGKAWEIVDLKSRNGTRVGRNYIARRTLEDGATIQIGQTSILFHVAGFVARRPSAPMEGAPDSAAESTVEHLLARAPARETGHLPQPKPRLPGTPPRDDGIPSSAMLSNSDTTLDASRAMDGPQMPRVPRTLPQPRVQEEGDVQANKRTPAKPAILVTCLIIVLVVAATVAWKLWR
jgi:pSer/pThr/pTyr-binding forkhead associated (FHA) protein